MNKLLKNKTFLAVLAAIFYVFGIFLVVDEYLWPKEHIAKAISFYTIGVLLLIYAIFLFIKLIKKNSNKYVQIFLFIEFIVNIVCAVLIMINKQGSIYLGICLYMRGLNELITHYITKYNRLSRFVLAIVMVTFATFMIASNLIKDEYFMYVLFAMIFGFAIYFTISYLKIPAKPRTKKVSKKTTKTETKEKKTTKNK